MVTKNGLLPKLDVFMTLGQTGYSRSFGGTIPNLDGPYYDAQIGLSFEQPIGNAAARAAYRRSVLNRQQAEDSLENLIQLAEVDVRSAYIDVKRLKEQITATAATRQAQQVTLTAETEKFRVGRSTALLVAAAQRDFVQAQINEVQAIVGYLKALITLYQLEGSLLEPLPWYTCPRANSRRPIPLCRARPGTFGGGIAAIIKSPAHPIWFSHFFEHKEHQGG